MNSTTVSAAFDALLHETGLTMQRAAVEVVAYAQQRSAHLSAIAGQVGFAEAMAAESRNVLNFAGIQAARAGDAADAAAHARVFGLIFGVLAAGA